MSPLDRLLAKEQVDIFIRELSIYLSEGRPEAFAILNYWLEVPDVETAKQLGCAKSYVKVLRHRGIEELRRRIRRKYEGY